METIDATQRVLPRQQESGLNYTDQYVLAVLRAYVCELPVSRHAHSNVLVIQVLVHICLCLSVAFIDQQGVQVAFR